MNNNLKLEMEKEFSKENNLKGIYSKYKTRKGVRKMNTVIGSLSAVFIILMFVTGNPAIRDSKNISEKIYGDEIIKNPSSNLENEDIINVNMLGLETEDIGGRAEEVDLISEYNFLENVAEKNNFEIGRQIKIYEAEYKGQKSEEYSKFQENVIFYDFKDNKEPDIEIRFSENELLGECIPILATDITTSKIQNQEVQIFERQILELEGNIIGKALFNIEGMNFKISVYDVSHEDFIEIVKTIIMEYRNK